MKMEERETKWPGRPTCVSLRYVPGALLGHGFKALSHKPALLFLCFRRIVENENNFGQL